MSKKVLVQAKRKKGTMDLVNNPKCLFLDQALFKFY